MRSLLTIVGLLVFVGCDLRGEMQRRSMENNLKQMEVALKNYEKSHRKTENPNRSRDLEESDPSSPPK